MDIKETGYVDVDWTRSMSVICEHGNFPLDSLKARNFLEDPRFEVPHCAI
jgi:hypothetical protein